jgi:hypothetical protein
MMSAAILVDQKAPNTEPMPTPLTDGYAPAVPTAQERTALANYGAAYNALMVDGIRRVTGGEPAARVFGPLLEAIQDSVSGTVGVEPDSARLVEYLTRLETRTAKWTVDNAATIAADELRKAVRAFIFGAHEDKAKVQAHKGLVIEPIGATA